MEIRRRLSKEYTKANNQQKQRKKRLKQELQQQLLSNYYLSKYQNHMAKLTNRSDSKKPQQNKSQQKKPLQKALNYSSLSRDSASLTPSKNTINFKHLIIQKKNAKKNFKHEISKRNSQQKQKNVKFLMFDSIKESLNQELQSKIPSKLQSGQYYSVQIMSKTIPVYHNRNKSQENGNNKIYTKNQSYYSNNSSRIQNSFIVPHIQENIQIKESNEFQEDSFDQYDKYSQGLWKQRDAQKIKLVQSAIRKTFQNRIEKNSNNSRKSSPNRSGASSLGQAKKRIQYISRNSKLSPNRVNSPATDKKLQNIRKYSSQASQASNTKNSRDNKKASDKKEKASPGLSEQSFRQKSSFSHSTKKNAKGVADGRRPSQQISELQPIQLINQYQNQMKQISRFSFQIANDNQLSFSKTSSQIQNQNNEIKNQSQGNSNILSNLDEITKPNEHFSKALDEQINKNYSHAQDQPSLQFRESIHDLSTISRFSMTSTQGFHIRQNLSRQIDQNQFGPYQKALVDLRDLIQDNPNARPIFVVGQRMLQDRQQYEIRKKNQANQMNRLQQKIYRKKKERMQIQFRRNSKIGDPIIIQNQIKIQQLIRQLAQRI